VDFRDTGRLAVVGSTRSGPATLQGGAAIGMGVDAIGRAL